MKMKKWLLGIFGGVVVIIAALYLIGVAYFNNHFLFNTTVSGVAVGQMDTHAAAQALNAAQKQRELTITENGQTVGTLKLVDYLTLPDGGTIIQNAKAQQHPWRWPLEILDPEKQALHSLALTGDVEQHAADQAFQSLKIDNEARQASQDATVEIDKDKENYHIKPETLGTRVDKTRFIARFNDAVTSGAATLDLKDTYQAPKVTADSQSLTTLVKRLNQLVKEPLTMKVGSQQVKIPTEAIQQWLQVDDKGRVSADTKAIDQYLLEWNQQHAGLLSAHTFNSTLSGQVSVQPGTYGWYISRPETSTAIAEALASGDHQVAATVVGQGSDQENFFGTSYVEVDIAQQKLFIYHNGEQVFTTDVATGADVTRTVPGAYQIWNKESPSVLVGTNGYTGEAYRTPVAYWVAFDERGQGIHDASWQPRFGGDWYHEHGSNGCVNVSPAVMGQVFSLVEVGMPVVVF